MQEILSKRKREVHGLQSRRWTVFDKVTQYQGPLKLYRRDRKIYDADTKRDQRTLKKLIVKLREQVDEQREELQNAIRGDRQMLRNTLSDEPSLLLMYQNMHPTKVVDALYQVNFNKKKYLDRIRSVIKNKTDELVKLKLQYAEFEDRIKYEKNEKIPEEETAMIITAKVEDAILKHETAIHIQHAYHNILKVIKKDSMYYDVMLNALQIDGYKQGRCMLKVTEMAQLATEYLDDRREEYMILESALKISMIERQNQIDDVKKEIEYLHNNVKFLIRRDSVIMLRDDDDEEKVFQRKSMFTLEDALNNINRVFDTIKEFAAVTKVEDIMPRFIFQDDQKKRLEILLTKSMNDRDTLAHKCHHAEEVYNSLSHSMVETTLWYKDEKERLLTSTKNYEEHTVEVMKLIRLRGEVYVRIRLCLQQLSEILRVLKMPEKTNKGTSTGPVGKKTPKKQTPRGSPHGSSKDGSKPHKKAARAAKIPVLPVFKPEICEADMKLLFKFVFNKLEFLLKKASVKEAVPLIAEQYFEKFVTKMIHTNVIDLSAKEIELIDESMFDDPQVPTNNDIKRISDEICEKNAKTEYEI